MSAEGARALEAFVRLAGAFDDLDVGLKTFQPGFDVEPVVTLVPGDVDRALGRLQAGELTAAQVARWAEALEMQDWVGCRSEDRELLTHLLFELASPEIHLPLTPKRVASLRARIADHVQGRGS